MRDDPRVKEKIELTLDTRQLVSIVLGSAVLLGIVFYLGVTVGKDLAGQDAGVAVAQLDRLDQQAAKQAEALTFADELVRDDVDLLQPIKRGAGEPAPKEAAPREEPKAAKADADLQAEAKQQEGGALPEPAAAPEAPAKDPQRDLSAALASQGERERQKPSEPAAPAEKPAEKKAPLDVSAALAKADAREAAPKAAAPAASQARGEAFTVQVAALPNRKEAEELVGKLRERGLPARIMEAEIQGRGTFYRIRIGRFGSREEANRYLEDLQRETRMSGFVAAVEN